MTGIWNGEKAAVLDAGLSAEEVVAVAEAVASTSWAWHEGRALMSRILFDLAQHQVARSEFGPRTEAFLRDVTETGTP